MIDVAIIIGDIEPDAVLVVEASDSVAVEGEVYPESGIEGIAVEV